MDKSDVTSFSFVCICICRKIKGAEIFTKVSGNNFSLKLTCEKKKGTVKKKIHITGPLNELSSLRRQDNGRGGGH